MLSRGLIEDLKKQHLETPEEIFDMETYRQSRQAAKEREKIRHASFSSLKCFYLLKLPQQRVKLSIDLKKIISCVFQFPKKTDKIVENEVQQ